MCIPTLHQLRVKNRKKMIIIRHLLGNVTRQFPVGVNLRIAISQLK